MNKEKFYRLAAVLGLVVAFASISLNALILSASDIQAQQIKERFDGILIDHDADIDGDLDVDGTANLDVVDIDGAVDLASTLALGGAVDMQNNIISNIGAAGTDFGATGGLTLADALTVTAGGATVSSGGLTVSAGLAAFSGGINCTPQDVTVTAGFTITVASCIVNMTSASVVTSSTTTGLITTTANSGDIVILQNNNATDIINIDGTGGTIECKANVALGASDTLTLMYNGTDSKWNCISSYDNS